MVIKIVDNGSFPYLIKLVNLAFMHSCNLFIVRPVLCSNEVKVTRYCAKVTFVYFLIVTK